MINGRCALSPVHLNVVGQRGLQPNDPVPTQGRQARGSTVAGLIELATHLHITLALLIVLPPCSLFPEQATLSYGSANTWQNSYPNISRKASWTRGRGNSGDVALHGFGTR